MIDAILFTEFSFTVLGVIWFLPSALREHEINQLEPFFSLWWDWAELHKDNDFPATYGEYYTESIHEAGWYDLEFEQWLDEIGAKPWDHFYKLCALERYLVKHKYVKRKCSWNHWVYQINKEKLF